MNLKRWVDRHTYHLLMLPGLMLMMVLIFIPVFYALRMSVFEYSMGSLQAPRFVGLENYIRLLSSGRFLLSIVRTLYYTVLSLIWPIVIGTIAALIFHQSFKGRGLARTLFLVPYMATPAAVALIWVLMFHPELGVINYLLQMVGLPTPLWIFSRHTVIPSLSMVEGWRLAPFFMIIVLGGLSAIPADVFEAAKVDGASPLQTFFHIILPLIRPHMIIATILIGILLLKSIDLIYVMTQGGPGRASETINILLYLEAFSFYHIGYASAIAVVFSIIIVITTEILMKYRRSES